MTYNHKVVRGYATAAAESAAELLGSGESLTGEQIDELGSGIERSGRAIRAEAAEWEPPAPTLPEPPSEPPPSVEVMPSYRTVTAWQDKWQDDSGVVRTSKIAGRSYLAEALQQMASRFPGEVIRVVNASKTSVRIATNEPGKKTAVDLEPGKPLRALVEGGTVTGLETNERYLGGGVDRESPAIEFLEFVKFTLDVRGAQTAYPFVTGVNTRLRHFGVQDVAIITDGGVGQTVKTPIRGNAAGEYVVRRAKNLTGANEYAVCYLNFGEGDSIVEDVEGVNGGRGVVQCAFRTTENFFAGAMASGEDSLIVRRVRSKDNGGKDGSNAVSIAGWGHGLIVVSDLHVETHWGAGGLAIVEDVKQSAVTGVAPNFVKVGPGFLLPPLANPSGEPTYAHHEVRVDLRGSTIVVGQDVAGQEFKSPREHVKITSCRRLQLLKDASTILGGFGKGIVTAEIEQTV